MHRNQSHQLESYTEMYTCALSAVKLFARNSEGGAKSLINALLNMENIQKLKIYKRKTL